MDGQTDGHDKTIYTNELNLTEIQSLKPSYGRGMNSDVSHFFKYIFYLDILILFLLRITSYFDLIRI